MSAETLAFPQTAETIARHVAHNPNAIVINDADTAVAYIAKRQGATIYQVRGDMADGHYSDAQIITLAQKVQALGIEVRQWNTYSFYDYNPLKDLEMTVAMTERERAKRPVDEPSVKQHSTATAN